MVKVSWYQELIFSHVLYVRGLWVMIPIYTLCGKWVHKRYSGMMGSPSNVADFTCSVCVK